MKQYKEVLLLNSSEVELSQCKYQLDMFGAAEHIHTETSGVSAMYYLRNAVQLPDLVIANLVKGETTVIDFILELEIFLRTSHKYTSILLIYNEEEKEYKQLDHFKQMKKPIRFLELLDDEYWSEIFLN